MEENLKGDSLLGTDGHGFYKKDTEGLRDGNGLISIFLPHPSSPARRGSTTPPKYFGFAEVLHARQGSNAFVIALA